MNDTDPNSGNRSFFAKLTTPYEALAMVQDTSKAFLIIGVLQLVTTLVSKQPWGLLDSGLNLIGGFALRKWHSRVVAVVLLVWSSLTLLGFFWADPAHRVGAAGLLFALVGVWAGVRATETTFKLRTTLALDATKTAPVATDEPH